MSEGPDDVCGMSEVIETEQVVEILEESQFLDLAASMETRGEVMEAVTGSPQDREEIRYRAGQKRKRGGMDSETLEEPSVFNLPLPTAVVPPSRQVIATPLPSQSQPSPVTSSAQDTTNLPAVNIQLTSDELQALIGILRQRGSTPQVTPSVTSHPHQLIAPKKVVAAVVMSPSTSSASSIPLPSSQAIMEAQTVAAAKASVQGKRRHCSCKNSQCLKLYCDCFSHEESCSSDCSCRNCRNNPAFSEMRELTMKMYRGKDPTAFHHSEEGEATGQRNKGCKCRKTLCLKKYCECFQTGLLCTSLCRCINCKNTASSGPPSLTDSSSLPLTQPANTPSLIHTTPNCDDDTLRATLLPENTIDIPSTTEVGCTSHLDNAQLTSTSPLPNSICTDSIQLLSHPSQT